MGFFDLFKKKSHQENNTNVNSGGGIYEKLTEDSGLPFGWVYQNRCFTEPAEKEYSNRLQQWIDSKKLPPVERVKPLKDFIDFLDDLEIRCKSKGECFEYWFYEIVASRDYIEQRKRELQELTEKLETLQGIHEKKSTLKSDIERILKENAGILQSDLKKMFDANLQNEVSETLYSMSQSGEIERIKTGRTYKLYYRG